MKKTIFILSVILIAYAGCKKPLNCDGSVLLGESVMIPIKFVGFVNSDVNIIQVYRYNKTNPGKIDTFSLDKLLWSHSAHSDREHLTDRALDGNTDPYYSYLNNYTLILDWTTNRDTLSDFVIKKSKGSYDNKCHKDDPIVKIDVLSFMHNGKTIVKGDSIIIVK